MTHADYIVVIFRDASDEICDFMDQTCRGLSSHATVLALMLYNTIGIRDLLRGEWVVQKNAFGYWQIRPLMIIPFYQYRFIWNVNIQLTAVLLTLGVHVARVCKRGRGGTYLWLFHPHEWQLFRFLSRLHTIVYDVVDYFGAREFRRSDTLSKLELDLIRHSDHVIVITERMRARLMRHTSQVILAPLGFRVDAFKKPHPIPQLLKDVLIKRPERPIIGFIGGLNHRLDYRLLLSVAKRLPQYRFALIGPDQSQQDENIRIPSGRTARALSSMQTLSNVILYPSAVKHKTLPSILSTFSICMIPYDMSQEFNTYCYPMKIMEYFFVGKPVVSTPIPSLLHYSEFIRFGKSVSEWCQHIEELLSHEWSVRIRKKQRQITAKHTWKQKIDFVWNTIHRAGT